MYTVQLLVSAELKILHPFYSRTSLARLYFLSENILSKRSASYFCLLTTT